MSDLCNLCGESCVLKESWEEFCGLRAKVTGGYLSTPGTGNGSGALEDLIQYRFNLCEFCLDYLFQKFIIPVEIHDVDIDWQPTGDDIGTFIPAAERVKNDDWRKHKKEFFEEPARRAKLRHHSMRL